MVKSCITAGCSNQLKDGVSLFKFPTEKNLRLKWTRQVQRTRAEWKGPTNNSYVCSKHFTEDCFQPLSVMSARMGMSMKQMLKPDVMPYQPFFISPMINLQVPDDIHLLMKNEKEPGYVYMQFVINNVHVMRVTRKRGSRISGSRNMDHDFDTESHAIIIILW